MTQAAAMSGNYFCGCVLPSSACEHLEKNRTVDQVNLMLEKFFPLRCIINFTRYVRREALFDEETIKSGDILKVKH